MPGATAVSIIVACRNEREHIRSFVESVLRQETGGLELEVIVADGMSDDGTRQLLADFAGLHPFLRVIDNPGRIVSTGLNAAVRIARGDIIVRMDAHTEYSPDYVRTCVEVLQATGAGNVGGPARTKVRGYRPRAIAAAYHSPFACGGAAFHNERHEGPVDTVPYGCWRKSTLLEVGLFDEDLVRNQDDELNYRIRKNGGTIWQSAGIKSWYRPRATLAGLFRQYFQYGFWKVAVIRKHRLPASWRHVVPGGFVFSLAALSLSSAGATWAGLGTAAAFSWFCLVAALALYSLVCLFASIGSAKRHGWDLLPILPAVFATFHMAYGIGFLTGLARWPLNPALHAESRAFSGLTR